MNKKIWTAFLLGFSFFTLLPACVNINVNIPEGVVQEASDDYVGELYRAKEKKKDAPANASPSPAPAGSKSSSIQIFNQLFESTAFAVDLQSTVAHPVRMDSDKAKAIHERQRARLGQVHSLKGAGILGESNDGTLVIKGAPKAGTEASVAKLVSDENADREELYAEIVSHNSLKKGHLVDIKQSFSRSFQKYSPSHAWVQDAAGNWSQKP